MRILVMTPSFLPFVGGAQKGIFEIYKRLASQHEIAILTPDLGQNYSSDYLGEEAFVDVESYFTLFRHPLYSSNPKAPDWPTPFTGDWYRMNTDAFRLCKSWKPDVINTHYIPYYGLATLFCTLLTRFPTVLSVVGRDVRSIASAPRLYRLLSILVLHKVTRIAFISDFARREVEGVVGLLDHSLIIPFGADAGAFDCSADRARNLRGILGIPQEAIVVFALQRLSRVKRLDVVIEAFRKVKSARSNVYLLIVGKGPERESLEELVDHLSLRDRVRVVGYIPTDELPDYFAMSNIFLFHSTYETFGVALIEALAAGLAVVCADTTAGKEIVQDGVTGLLAQPLDPVNLAEKLILLIDDPDFRKYLARNGKHAAVTCYDWDIVAEAYNATLTEVFVSKRKIRLR